MTPEEARAIAEKIGMDALELYGRVQAQGSFTERDMAEHTELWSRYVDYLDLLDTNPVQYPPSQTLDEVADRIMELIYE